LKLDHHTDAGAPNVARRHKAGLHVELASQGLGFVNRGFLRSAAPLSSDLTLAVEIGMGVALLAGMLLARRGRYRAHAWCQSAVVLLNLMAITLTMAPSFRRSFSATTAAAFRNSYYALAAAHAALGTLAELLGLYILLVAGTSIVPKRLRFTRYKPWMRTALALWWVVLLLGVGTYVRWYVAPLFK
jgi:uncharacterized membrane protein YozB (DUF420 family)